MDDVETARAVTLDEVGAGIVFSGCRFESWRMRMVPLEVPSASCDGVEVGQMAMAVGEVDGPGISIGVPSVEWALSVKWVSVKISPFFGMAC